MQLVFMRTDCNFHLAYYLIRMLQQELFLWVLFTNIDCWWCPIEGSHTVNMRVWNSDIKVFNWYKVPCLMKCNCQSCEISRFKHTILQSHWKENKNKFLLRSILLNRWNKWHILIKIPKIQKGDISFIKILFITILHCCSLLFL